MTAAEVHFLSLEDVAARLQVSDQTVRRWIKSGKLRAYKPGLEYRIREADLQEFLRAREVRPKAPRRSPFEPSFHDVLEEERRSKLAELEWLPGYLLFLNQQTQSMRARWEAAIEGNTVEPGAWSEAAEVVMYLGKRFVEKVPPSLYATEDRGPLREEWGDAAADALGSLMSLRATLDVAYHVCERRLGEKGDLDDVVVLDRFREQRRRFHEEVPEPLKAAGAA